MLFRNKKTGELYEAIDEGVDCTNSRGDLEVIIYKGMVEGSSLFVREATEFYEKFEAVH